MDVVRSGEYRIVVGATVDFIRFSCPAGAANAQTAILCSFCKSPVITSIPLLWQLGCFIWRLLTLIPGDDTPFFCNCFCFVSGGAGCGASSAPRQRRHSGA